MDVRLENRKRLMGRLLVRKLFASTRSIRVRSCGCGGERCIRHPTFKIDARQR